MVSPNASKRVGDVWSCVEAILGKNEKKVKQSKSMK